MNISNMNSNFVNTLFSSTNRGSQFSFNASMYTDIRSIKRSTFKHLFNELGVTDNKRPSYNNKTDKNKTDSEAAAALKSSASELKTSASLLTSSGSNSVFKKLEGTSSDTSSIEKSYVDGALANTKKSVEVNVKQVAKSQQNTGTVLNSSEKSLAAGSYSFEVETGGKKTTLTFSLSQKDTNATMQQKLADTINKAGLGITAKMNTSNKQSFLTIEADKTGIANTSGDNKVFSISDKYGGSAISTLGLNNTTREAQNAIYSVNNGMDRVSQSNTVDLGGNAKAVLKDVSSGNVTLTFGNNRSAVTSAVKDFVNDFNNLLKTTQSYGNQSKNIDRLHSSLSSMSTTNRYALSSIGLTVDQKGYISVDENKLKNANMNKIEDIFTGAGSFANSVNNKASNIYSNANRYATQSYSNYGKQDSPYSSATSGGLYNSWF